MPHDSFLPPEYVEQKRDRRTSLLAIGLFAVIVFAIAAAFLHRQDQLQRAIERQEHAIERTREAGQQVALLTNLQASRLQMLDRAELAAALVERVPRSILMAQLIGRMPEGLALTEFDLGSTRIRTPPSEVVVDASGRRTARTAAATDPAPIEVPRYVVRLGLKGVAPTDLHVSEFLAALNDDPLLERVRLESTQEDVVDRDIVRRFEITCALVPDADVRTDGGTP
ncbi:MAG TPA: hypothetical protein DEO57_06825 [Phycisphaerales bacterium]|nr:hypothetical protein [Phycisphaerales bacterium]